MLLIFRRLKEQYQYDRKLQAKLKIWILYDGINCFLHSCCELSTKILSYQIFF